MLMPIPKSIGLLIVSFLGYSQKLTLDLALKALGFMVKDPTFSGLQPDLSKLQTFVDQFMAAKTAALTRDAKSVLALGTALKNLQVQLGIVATGANNIVGDNVTLALETGFPLREARQKNAPLKPPRHVKSYYNVNEDTIELKWTTVKGAKYYNVRYKGRTEKEYKIMSSSKPELLLPVSADATERLFISVQAVSRDKQSGWSDVVAQ
jgi:hypothetical protein